MVKLEVIEHPRHVLFFFLGNLVSHVFFLGVARFDCWALSYRILRATEHTGKQTPTNFPRSAGWTENIITTTVT